MDKEAVGLVWKYEQGGMTRDEAIDMLRLLIHSGEIWNLPDHYLEQATRVIDLGYLNKGGGQ